MNGNLNEENGCTSELNAKMRVRCRAHHREGALGGASAPTHTQNICTWCVLSSHRPQVLGVFMGASGNARRVEEGPGSFTAAADAAGWRRQVVTLSSQPTCKDAAPPLQAATRWSCEPKAAAHHSATLDAHLHRFRLLP